MLTVDVVQKRLRTAMASEQPQSTAAYDNMRGSEKLRTAMAVRMRNSHGFGFSKDTFPGELIARKRAWETCEARQPNQNVPEAEANLRHEPAYSTSLRPKAQWHA
jgi:hypothetical protein